MGSIKGVIQETVNETIAKLKKAGLMRDGEKPVTKKTEDLLKKYKDLKVIEHEPGSAADVMLKRIDEALDALQEDEYCGLIEMIYFDNATREECAEFYDVEPVTITRNKKRLLDKMSNILFADEVIKEIFN